MNRPFLIFAASLIVSVTAGLAHAQSTSDDPDLAIAVVNTIADVCFQTARGDPPKHRTAEQFLLAPLPATPPAFVERFGYIPNWFDLKRKPNNVFVAVGDKPGACHIIIGNTTQTIEIQAKVATTLAATGFKPVAMGQSADPAMNDQIFVKSVSDGYMLVNIHGPRQPLRNGVGEQGAIHVSLMSKEMFESIIKPQR